MLTRVLLFFFLTTLILSPIQAQTTVPVRDPQALTLIALSLKALTGGVAVNDVTLQGTAAYIAGSDEESGTATLTARGNQQSLVQLNLSGGTRQEIRNGPAGAWSGPDGTVHSMATHNCWTDADWFYPVLTLEALQTDSTLGVLYIGPAVWNGVPVVDLQFSHTIPGQTPDMTAEIQNLSTLDFYFDPSPLLPLALDFNTHPDNDLNRNIPEEIQFGSYQSTDGVLVPFHIQKFLQGTLNLDLTLSQAQINPVVPPGTFTLPQPSTGGVQ